MTDTVSQLSRRGLLAAGASAAASAAFGAPSERKLGMIFPGTGGGGDPRDARQMYPTGVSYISKGVGLPAMTVAGYASVIDKIGPLSVELKAEGAEALMLMGTSLSFYNGAAFNRELTARMTKAAGLKASTMSTAVADGLRSVGAKRVAVGTAYIDEVNQRLMTFLREEGFEVLALKGFNISDVSPGGPLSKITQGDLIKLGTDVYAEAPKADAILLSCGALRTLEVLAPLEQQTKLPVVSSMPHALRAGVRLLGLDGRYPGHGVLLNTA
jgi:arylmalonate decarboxylase